MQTGMLQMHVNGNSKMVEGGGGLSMVQSTEGGRRKRERTVTPVKPWWVLGPVEKESGNVAELCETDVKKRPLPVVDGSQIASGGSWTSKTRGQTVLVSTKKVGVKEPGMEARKKAKVSVNEKGAWAGTVAEEIGEVIPKADRGCEIPRGNRERANGVEGLPGRSTKSGRVVTPSKPWWVITEQCGTPGLGDRETEKSPASATHAREGKRPIAKEDLGGVARKGMKVDEGKREGARRVEKRVKGVNKLLFKAEGEDLGCGTRVGGTGEGIRRTTRCLTPRRDWWVLPKRDPVEACGAVEAVARGMEMEGGSLGNVSPGTMVEGQGKKGKASVANGSPGSRVDDHPSKVGAGSRRRGGRRGGRLARGNSEEMAVPQEMVGSDAPSVVLVEQGLARTTRCLTQRRDWWVLPKGDPVEACGPVEAVQRGMEKEGGAPLANVSPGTMGEREEKKKDEATLANGSPGARVGDRPSKVVSVSRRRGGTRRSRGRKRTHRLASRKGEEKDVAQGTVGSDASLVVLVEQGLNGDEYRALEEGEGVQVGVLAAGGAEEGVEVGEEAGPREEVLQDLSARASGEQGEEAGDAVEFEVAEGVVNGGESMLARVASVDSSEKGPGEPRENAVTDLEHVSAPSVVEQRVTKRKRVVRRWGRPKHRGRSRRLAGEVRAAVGGDRENGGLEKVEVEENGPGPKITSPCGDVKDVGRGPAVARDEAPKLTGIHASLRRLLQSLKVEPGFANNGGCNTMQEANGKHH